LCSEKVCWDAIAKQKLMKKIPVDYSILLKDHGKNEDPIDSKEKIGSN